MSRNALTLKTDTVPLPVFPNFDSLGPHHQTALAQATRANHLYSDYNFISLWSWDHQNKLKISTLNDNLVIRFQDYIDPEAYFYSFFGVNKVDETARILLEKSVAEGVHELKLIPQFVIENLRHPDNFVVNEDRDNFDYIVAIDNMIKPTSDKKRWSLSQFLRKHGAAMVVRELDIKDPETAAQVLALGAKWSMQTNSQEDYAGNEGRAIKKIFENHHRIGSDDLHLLGIYLGDELKAFSLTETIGDGFAMAHYKKMDRDYRGLGVAIEHYTAAALKEKGVSNLNHEQDLGIEGLRAAKMSNKPAYFIKKYTLALPG